MSFTTSESTKEIYTALAQAQLEFKPVVRNRKVTVNTKSGSYSYYYATLDTINSACMPALNKFGIAVIQPHLIQDSKVVVVTRLCHTSGEYIETSVTWSGQENLQAMGGVMTYLRRYSLSGLLGIAAQTDEDGGPPVGGDHGRRGAGQAAPAQKPQPKVDPVVKERLLILKTQWFKANPEYKSLSASERASRFYDWVNQVLGPGNWLDESFWTVEQIEMAGTALFDHEPKAESQNETAVVEEVVEEVVTEGENGK